MIFPFSRIKLMVFFLLLWTTFVQAQDIPARPTVPGLVYDYANLLNAGEKSTLERKLFNYADSTSTQIAVVSMNDIGGYDIADYAVQLADKWGIGTKGKDNGLLILVVKDTRAVFIATGYGMESTIPDAIAKRLVEQIIIPNFKQGLFYNGLDQVTNAIFQLMAGTYESSGEPKGFPSLYVLLIILFFIVVFSLVFGKAGANWNSGGGGFSSGGYSSGGGFGGGSSFGGFGGGGFGGGGAGGRW